MALNGERILDFCHFRISRHRGLVVALLYWDSEYSEYSLSCNDRSPVFVHVEHSKRLHIWKIISVTATQRRRH